MKHLSTLALLALLAGCSAPAPSTPAPASTAPATATPSPTASTATENQVASVVAGIQPMARKVIDQAGDCRFDIVMTRDGGGTAADEAHAISCYANEVTLGTRAVGAARELEALTPPASMASLTRETIAALRLAGSNLEADCGEVFGTIQATEDCNAALGQRYSAYGTLDVALAKWSPWIKG